MSIRGARSSAFHPASEGLQEPFSSLKVMCTEMVTIVFFLCSFLVLCIMYFSLALFFLLYFC